MPYAPRKTPPLTDAQWAMYSSCTNMLKKAVMRLIYKGCTYDEAYDLCVDALIRAAQAFDPARGLKFSTLAYPSLFRLTAMRKNQRIKKAAKRGSEWSFDQFDGPSGERFVDMFAAPKPNDPDRAATKAKQFAAIERAMVILTEPERETIYARMIGVTFDELGKWRGLTKEAIRLQERRALAKLRRFFGSESGMSIGKAVSRGSHRRKQAALTPPAGMG